MTLKFLSLGGIIVVLCSMFLVNTDDNSSLSQWQSQQKLEDNSVYLILRGSNTKLGGFAKVYNRTHANATHVALAIMEDTLTVHHVNTGKGLPTNYFSESLAQFADSEKELYTYLGIWKIKNIDSDDIIKLKKQIKSFNSTSIKFDYAFDIKNDDELYCSEFVYKTLNHLDSKRFEFSMNTKEVPKEHRFFLKKDTLTYYPTDFFLGHENFDFIAEWHKEEAVN